LHLPFLIFLHSAFIRACDLHLSVAALQVGKVAASTHIYSIGFQPIRILCDNNLVGSETVLLRISIHCFVKVSINTNPYSFTGKVIEIVLLLYRVKCPVFESYIEYLI